MEMETGDLSSFARCLRKVLWTELNSHKLCGENIVLSKRTKDFKQGDFCVPRGCLNDDISQEILDDIRQKLLQQSQGWSVKIQEVKSDSFNAFVIHVNRVDLYKQEMTRLIKTSTVTKSKCQDTPVKHVTMNVTTFMDQADDENISLNDLRALVLAQHVSCLLKADGYTVQYSAMPCERAMFNELFNFLNFYPDIKYNEFDQKRLIFDKLRVHRCCMSVEKEDKNCDSGQTDPVQNMCKKSIVLDLKMYLHEEKLSVGKGSFDKNLHLIEVSTKSNNSDVLSQVNQLYSMSQELENPTICLHIVPQSQSFNQQKVHLLLRAVSENPDFHQSHLVYGSVLLSKSSDIVGCLNATQYIGQKRKEVTAASVMKYGDAVKGKGWERTLSDITAACVKFELLSTVAGKTVKLAVSSESGATGQQADLGSGSFVMYNCARLATLFSKFEEEVQKGVYPKLPPVEEINFALLREESEWELIFSYVAPFSDLVPIIVQELKSEGTILANIHTHKICGMLVSLSRCLSSYYSRFHVLGEARPHLLPTMFARLYLLMAIHDVMVRSLYLLGIPAPSQL